MILVVGSTGSVGSRVTTKLASMGRQVAALVRDTTSDKAKALAASGAKLVVGDLKDPKSLSAALEGVDTVVCTASSTMSRQDGDSIDTVDKQGLQNLIGAAEAKAVKQFILVSFSHNIGNDFPLSEGKRAAEKRLEAGKLDYTILLPSYFLETWLSPAVGFDVASGGVRIYGDGTKKVSLIALDDVVDAVVGAVGNPQASRKSIQIGGPSPISFLEVVALVERATGKKLKVDHMTLDQISGARAAEKDPMSASFLGLFYYLAQGDAVPADWATTLKVKPTSAEQWIVRAFGR
jgi:uncharacterized protein YbjT (DUF2867 family)